MSDIRLYRQFQYMLEACLNILVLDMQVRCVILFVLGIGMFSSAQTTVAVLTFWE
jgi:hypothetical protein